MFPKSSIYKTLSIARKSFRVSRILFSTNRNPDFYSQPTSKSHPHLIQKDEVTPGLTKNDYAKRRYNLMKHILQTQIKDSHTFEGHLVIIPSSTTVYMTENIPYEFRQNTDFLYLSGFQETNSVLLLHTDNKNPLPEHESTMFMPKGNSHSDRWEGSKMDPNTTTNFLGVSSALHMEELENFLQSFAKFKEKFIVWYDHLNSPTLPMHQTICDFISSYINDISVQSPRKILHTLRLIKSSAEIQLMRETCKIAAESMREVIKSSRPMISESHLHAKMDYECRIRGAEFLAFPPVVAGEDRANTIHYIQNNQIISNGSMILMDAGCEYHGYTSDMARTWPVNGKFSNPQKEIYELILSVQEELIESCKNHPPLDELFKTMCQSMGSKLQKLGLIPSAATEDEVFQAAYRFCPHHVSHYLGMDVHDTSQISRNIKLQPGMIITIEPGKFI